MYKKNLRFSELQYAYAAIIIFVFLIIFYFVPKLIGNESVYLIASRQLFEPHFLSNDWSVGGKPQQRIFGFAFSLIVAPLWLWFKSPIAMALASRILTWSFLVYALTRLGKQLGVKWLTFAAGIICWILSYQSVAAFEWIFGGAEQKCFAYGFIFLACAHLMQKRMTWAAVCAAVAVYFHILVGGYGAMALGFALLICWRSYGWKRVLSFLSITAMLGLPFVAVVFNLVSVEGHIDVLSDVQIAPDAVNVLFRNPHHLDPNYFLTPKKAVAKLIYCICTCFAVTQLLDKRKAKFVLSFLGFLGVVYFVGVIARQFDFFLPLKYYPFRVFDTLLPLFFWLTVPALLLKESRKFLKSGVPSPSKHQAVMPKLAALCLAAIFSVGVIGGYVIPNFKKGVVGFYNAWNTYLVQPVGDFDEMANWIQENLPTSATLIAPPWLENIWIATERAVVVNFKIAPANALILDWHQRMMALNGDNEFRDVGMRINKELRQNFPKLDKNQIFKIAETYGANYYLTTKENPDLSPTALIHHNVKYFLYDLSLMG